MTKSELIQYLRQYKKADDALQDALTRREGLEDKLYAAQYKPTVKYESPSKSIWGTVLLYFLPITAILSVIVWLFVLLFFARQFRIDHGGPVGVYRWSLCVTSIIVLPLCIFCTRSSKRQDLEKMQQYHERMATVPALQQQIQAWTAKAQVAQQNLDALASWNVVPRNYLDYAGRLLRYLENQRADTLKEALNLLEIDLREDARDDADWAFRKQMREQAARAAEAAEYQASRQADAAERAAQASEQTAMWAATTAAIAAAEAERQRKRDKGPF